MANRPRRRIETEAIHAGELHDPSGAHIAPIYQSSTYTFDGMGAVEAWGSGDSEAFIYARRANPTRQALAAKLAALEGHGSRSGEGQVAGEIFGSGMAAITAAIMGIAKGGDHIVAQRVLYGSADHLISDLLPQYGITSSRIPELDPDLLEQELSERSNVRVVYLETPANPTMTLIDIEKTSEIAHAHGARVVVDNTFATPVLQRPLALGADVVVHSTTKYINGHGTVIGGAIVSADAQLMDEEIPALVRFTGAIPSPFDCWLTNIGLKTLPLRMRQHCLTTDEVAKFLDLHAAVAETHYPGLISHPQHDLATRQMDGFGAMLAFDVGSYEAAAHVLDRVELCTVAVSLGNVDTLIEHPASMTHRGIEPEVRAASGITDGLLRLSVGLEAGADIIADLDQALGAP